jgi:hypothetical protein
MFIEQPSYDKDINQSTYAEEGKVGETFHH